MKKLTLGIAALGLTVARCATGIVEDVVERAHTTGKHVTLGVVDAYRRLTVITNAIRQGIASGDFFGITYGTTADGYKGFSTADGDVEQCNSSLVMCVYLYTKRVSDGRPIARC